MSNNDPTYDVAISFLASEVQTAQTLADKLEASGLKVFFYPRNQEELAGTDGMESMRKPFIDSRVVVILFKSPWGQTPWTRIEETAIKDRCFNHGWDGLMFVTLDKTSARPGWVPPTLIRFSFPDFGLEQLAGAIKARAQDLGGVISPPDAMTTAKLVQRKAKYLEARKSKMRDRAWIEGTVHKSLHETFVELIRLVQQANSQHGFAIAARANSYQVCGMHNGSVSVGVYWNQPFYTSVDDDPHGDCYLRVVEFPIRIPLPGEGTMMLRNPPVLKEHRFKVGVSETLELVWIEQGKQGQIARDQLANRMMMILLELISLDNQGQVQRRSFLED